jgi:hypothetical protein
MKKEKSLILNKFTDKIRYKLDNLIPYTTYEMSVVAGNEHGFSKWTITSFITSEEGKN